MIGKFLLFLSITLFKFLRTSTKNTKAPQTRLFEEISGKMRTFDFRMNFEFQNGHLYIFWT